MVKAKLIPPRGFDGSFLIPRFDGAILYQEWKDVLWVKFVTEAPRTHMPSEQQYGDRNLRSRRDDEHLGINRIYFEEGLTVHKRKARRKAAGTRAPIPFEARPNAP